MKNPFRYLIFLFFVYFIGSLFTLLFITWVFASDPITLLTAKENLPLSIILGIIGGGGIWLYNFLSQRKR